MADRDPGDVFRAYAEQLWALKAWMEHARASHDWAQTAELEQRWDRLADG